MGGATPLISESLLDESDDGCVDFNLFSLSGGLRMDASRDRSGDGGDICRPVGRQVFTRSPEAQRCRGYRAGAPISLGFN